MDWLQEKEQLEKFLKDNISYEEMGRYYGVSGTAVKKQLKKMGKPKQVAHDIASR